MEADVEHPDWEIILTGECMEMKNVKAVFSPIYARKPCPFIDKFIDKVWCEKVQNNSRLYNASKFRFHGLTRDSNGHAVLQIGLSDYKETICTNHFKPIEDVYEYGIVTYSDKFACIGSAIGVASVVVTSDGFVVIIKRSSWVAEAQNMLDTPGGHAEPEVYKYFLFCGFLF